MSKPLVSIITPSYNQAQFIRWTIESVLSQDYDNVEYIVVDGGSTDGSLDIIKEYSDKLTYISEKDNGQSDAINKGFRMAHGEIVAWLNSDDTYEPGCITRAVAEFEKNEKLGLVYGDGYITDAANNKVKLFEHTQEFDLWKLANFWDYIMQPATFFRASFLKKVGYLDVDLHYCMDWDLWIKLANVSEVKYVNECLACSREYGETKTSTGGERRLEEITRLLRKYSGKENPLGIYSYQASTRYTKYATNKLFAWVMAKYLAKVHEKLYAQMPVRYADGWIGEKYEFCVPAYCTECCLEVDCILPANLLKVTITIDHEYVKKWDLVERKVILKLAPTGSLHTIGVECKDAVVAGANDSRKLSIRMKDIIFRNEIESAKDMNEGK